MNIKLCNFILLQNTIGTFFHKKAYQSMNIVVDIGNSFIKVAVFNKDEIIQQEQFISGQLNILNTIFIQFPNIKDGIISMVGSSDKRTNDLLQSKLKKIILLDESTVLPIDNLYKTKKTLGKDRLAAVVGANYLFPKNNILVIDAGTAITFDFVDSDGKYRGGSISPGLHMRYKALHEFTSNLPLLAPREYYSSPAVTTEDSIIAGVQSGMVNEIMGIINEYQEQYPELKIVLTGGDAIFFERILKNSIFVDLNLVLKGLNRILAYNA